MKPRRWTRGGETSCSAEFAAHPFPAVRQCFAAAGHRHQCFPDRPFSGHQMTSDLTRSSVRSGHFKMTWPTLRSQVMWPVIWPVIWPPFKIESVQKIAKNFFNSYESSKNYQINPKEVIKQKIRSNREIEFKFWSMLGKVLMIFVENSDEAQFLKDSGTDKWDRDRYWSRELFKFLNSHKNHYSY